MIFRAVLLGLGVFLLSSLLSAHAPLAVRHASPITAGDDWSGFPSISADGRWVAFASNAGNLVDGDTNQTADIFVFDRLTGETERVSVSSDGAQANAISTRPAISADGRFVAFESLADNLVFGDLNFLSDIFVHDRLTGVTGRVSVDANGAEGNGWSEQASISADGHYVAFLSAADNLLPNDDNGLRDAFLHNRMSGYTQRVSIRANGEQADGESSYVAVTPSGRTAVFTSQAGNLAGAAKPGSNVFAHNRLVPSTLQIPGTSAAAGPDTSTGGQWIAYRLPVDPDTDHHVYVYDQIARSTTTARFPALLTQHDLGDDGGHIAAIGQTITRSNFNLYWHDLESGETLVLAEDVSDMRPAISGDGQVIAFVQDVDGIPQISILDRRGARPEPTYFISGRVVGPLGDPLALVEIEDNHGNIVYTDRLGRFWISGIPTGQVSLSISKEGFDFQPRAASFVVVSDLSDKEFGYHYTKVIDEARLDIGMPYDHRCEGPGCQGVFHGYAAGQCSDLVLDAFTWGADYDIKMELENDAQAHPEHFYQNRNARDAFDMWRYFMYSQQMLTSSEPYQPGDMVFFDWGGDGEIDHVALVSQVDARNQPTWMVDATGVIASNPNGLAAELPWEPFHERSERGHARWHGAYESAVLEPPQGQFLQVGLGSVSANLHLLSAQGLSIGSTASSLPGGTFFDLTWEQNLTLADPLGEASALDGWLPYYIVISNPTAQQMPYYFVTQTVQDGDVSQVVKFTGQLDPHGVRYLPLMVGVGEDGVLDFEFVPFSRKSGGALR